MRAQPGILPPRAHQGTPAQQLLNLDDSFDEDINEDLPTDETITIQPTTSTATTTASSKKSDNNTKVTNTADTSKFSSVLKRKAVQRDKAHADGTTAGEEEYIDVFRIMRDTEAKYDRTATEMYLGLSNIATSSSFTSSVTLHAHGHRERHKKYVIQNSTKGQGHDKTQSKLKANSSSHKDVIHIDMDNKIEMVDDSDDDDDEEDEEKDEDDQIILVASAFHVIVVAHSESAAPQTNLLDEVRPGFIVMYDADMGVVRSIEVYNAQHSSRIQPLKVYLLMYENSVEEHRYMTLVAKEKRSFEQLIIAKETLVISLPDNAVDLEKERLLTLDGGVHSSDTRISNKNNGIDKKNMKIVVDVRDFRSTLPSLLYGGGLAVVPRTLLVGDYVLSAEVCVERKGISDLFQSLASGRLYNQVRKIFDLI